MKIIFLILLLTVNISIAQTDSIKYDVNGLAKLEKIKLTQDSLSIEIGELNLQLIENLKNKDSLNRELLYYKVKEDYYSSALSNQTNKFGVIITVIVGLFALISFGAFKYEIIRLNEESDEKFIKQKKLFKKQKKKNGKIKSSLERARGNLHVTIALLLKKEENYKAAFIYYIMGARDRLVDIKRYSIDEEYPVLIQNLNSAMKMLGKITPSKNVIEYLNKENEAINKCLNKLLKTENLKVRNLTSEIITKLEELNKIEVKEES